jgi:hypothetical protein
MKPNPLSTLRKLFSFLVAWVILSSLQAEEPGFQSVRAATADTACRFGITSPLVSDGYDVASIGVGSYLDWGAVSNPSLPVGVEYIRVLRLRDDIYPQTLANLPSWVQANPGSVWVVGNEPDTVYGNQDALIPEVYAARYFDLATIIRDLDPSAMIAFGSIVQPTPIRMRYLDRAWNQLSIEAGSPAAASALVDLWSIHSFILNEQLGSWGTGIPPGFENDHADAVVITNFADTHSIDIFQQRIIAFRSWLSSKGEREKPLWITEYGSLFPPIDPPDGPDYVNVSDQDTASFMLATFDFMLSGADRQIGHPGDGNQLVQRWFWYSLNEYRYIFGGSIFDPDNEKILTVVGNAFTDYQSNNLAQPDLYPLSLTTVPVSYVSDGTLVNYRLDLTIENALFADASCAQVWIYDGDPESGGTLIAGPIWSSAIQSYYGTGKVSADWKAVQPLTQHTLYVLVNPVGVSDTNPDNNQASFLVYTDLPKLIFLPLLQR